MRPFTFQTDLYVNMRSQRNNLQIFCIFVSLPWQVSGSRFQQNLSMNYSKTANSSSTQRYMMCVFVVVLVHNTHLHLKFMIYWCTHVMYSKQSEQKKQKRFYNVIFSENAFQMEISGKMPQKCTNWLQFYLFIYRWREGKALKMSQIASHCFNCTNIP